LARRYSGHCLKALRKIRNLSIALAAFTAFGTIGFHLIEGWNLFDAFYMTVITFSTVGYAEVHPLSHAGRIFTVVVIVFGVGLVYFAIATLSALLLEFELDKVFGRRRMERELERISGHFIICGAGRVGRSAAREFERNRVPFVVIESQEARAGEKAEQWLTIVGNATQEKVLRSAHIERARGIVAATTTDATNIYIVLTARAINPKLKIIARASEEEAEKHLKKAGADSVISPYKSAGHRVAQSFLRPNVVDFLTISSCSSRSTAMSRKSTTFGRRKLCATRCPADLYGEMTESAPAFFKCFSASSSLARAMIFSFGLRERAVSTM